MSTVNHLMRTKVRRLTRLCLFVWAGVTLLPVWLARHPNLQIAGWPLDFWMAAQGCVLVYLALVVFYAWQINRWERLSGTSVIDMPSEPPR